MVSLLIKREFLDLDLLQTLEILFLKNPFLFKDLIKDDLLDPYSPSFLLGFLGAKRVLNAFRSICFIKYLKKATKPPLETAMEFAELLKASLNDPLISVRQASASCFKALNKVLTVNEI